MASSSPPGAASTSRATPAPPPDLAADVDPNATLLQRFEAIWSRVIDLFATHRRLWLANFDTLSQIDQLPEKVRRVIAEAQQHGRLGPATLFQGIDPLADEERRLPW
jgi:hypothetical protein